VPDPSLGIPAWIAHAAEAGLALAAAAFLYFVWSWARKAKRRPPLIVFVPALAQLIWFVPARSSPDFLALIPFFHGLQYMLVAWYMQMQERLSEDGAKPTTGRLSRETLWWAAGNGAGYWLLFWIFPKAIAAAVGGSPALAGPVAIAGVQLHHFFVDGVIWKLRHKKVQAPMLTPLGAARA
jgi:hypothetical protein